MIKSNKIFAVLVAGGSGKRLGNSIPKQYLPILGQEMLLYSLKTLLSHPRVAKVLVVIAKKDLKLYEKALSKLEKNLKTKLLKPAIGGLDRQASVLNGLIAIEKERPEIVLIHDAARPFLSSTLLDSLIDATNNSNAVIPGLIISDTLKEIKNSSIEKTLNRENIFSVQTPQVFNYKKIFSLHKKYAGKNFSDDAALFERAYLKVKVLKTSEKNFKITTKEDLKMAELLMSGNFETRVGKGFDVHAFSKEYSQKNFVILGGVKIPHSFKLLGHSDADVAIHALVDGILGAIGEGDIGRIFPPSEKKWKGADSKIFLSHAKNLVTQRNGKIVNVDITIICEEPKITPHAKDMQKNIARILEIENDRVNIKATTTEKLGFTGRKEGIAAEAIATIKLPI